MLFLQHARCQGLNSIFFEYWNPVLGDNGSAVEFLGNEMNRYAMLLVLRIQRALVGVNARIPG